MGRLKMRLRAVLALLFLVAWVSAARNGARGSGSRRTSSNCRGSSSRSSSSSGSSVGGRGSTLCRPTTTTTQTDQARPSSSSNSFGVTKRPPIKRPTKKATRKTTASSSSTNSANSDNSSLRGFTKSTTRTIPKKTVTKKFTLPQKTRRTTVSSTDHESVSDSIKSTTKILPKKTAPKRFKPPKKTRRTTVSSAAHADEENSSDSSTNTKTPAKKYFQKLKTRLQTAAIWFAENKDKTLDEILVERWKEKCSGTDSKKEKRKRRVAAALAEREEDTPQEKLVKGALKSLLEEDSDEVYEFLSRSSSRTFQDIENEGDTLRPTSPVDAEKNSDSATKIKTILSSSTRRPPKRIPTKRTTSITRVSHATSLKRTTVSSASPVDEASSDGEAQDLGAGDDGDCQPQGRSKRTKRQTCYKYNPRKDLRRYEKLPAPAATENFERRHLMDDDLFNHYYKKVQATGKDTYKEDLQNYRYDRNWEWVSKNTIIKETDLAKLVSYGDSTAWVDPKTKEKWWQTNQKIEILQVDEKNGVKAYEDYVNFSFTSEDPNKGLLQHMFPPNEAYGL